VKYCPQCSYVVAEFHGDQCPACQRVEQNSGSPIAREYVAGYFRDHPLRVPGSLLQQLREC